MAGIKHDPTTHTYGGSLSQGMAGMGGGDWIVNTGKGGTAAATGTQKQWLMWAALGVGAWWLLKKKS